MTPERDWKRLGREFAEARRAVGLTQVEAAERLSVTRAPIQGIERGIQGNGRPFSRVTRTMRAYARLVGWTDGSPARILDGQEPEPATQPVSERAAEPSTGLPPAVDLELRSGRTLDSTVVHLRPEDDDDTRIIVVLKGADDLTEEELTRLWQQWRRTRRQLQAMPSDPEVSQET